ncbi:hypothetical protein EON64_03030 [archaeon]|nr:MAG: hypothetical protein EON64_03030 [archaeon]
MERFLEGVGYIRCHTLTDLLATLTSLPPLMGCTAFPALGLRVTPTRGAALVFCNLMPDGVGDVRVSHGGEGVPSPLVKYGMNIWVCSDPLASDLGLVEGSIGAKGGGEGKKGKGNKEEDGHCGKGSGKGLSALERAEVETRVHMRMRMGCVDMKEEGGGEESVEGEDRAERLADLFIQQFRPDTMSVKEYRIRQGAVAEVLQERSERSEKKERSKRKVQAVKSAVVRNSIEQKNDVEADQDTEDVACKKRKETNIAP